MRKEREVGIRLDRLAAAVGFCPIHAILL
jgi:hypothetical protein